MNQELIQALKELEREKGLPFETILAGLEDALASAFKSYKRQHDPELDEETTGARVQLDPESGEMRAWLQELAEEHERHGQPPCRLVSSIHRTLSTARGCPGLRRT